MDLRAARHVPVTCIAGGFFIRLRPKEGNAECPPEDVVSPHPHFGLCPFRQGIAERDQRFDQRVQRRMIADINKIFDHPHLQYPPAPNMPS